jgi:Fe-S-cluster containining protein
VVVSDEERTLLEGLADQATRPLRWIPDLLGFWSLSASPCPFYDGRCKVYASRPYNCRRFGCFRHDPQTEPFNDGQCFWTRFHGDRAVRRQAKAMQRKAQRWANAHGWRDEDEA